MGCKPKRAFADGGAIGADGLTDAQRAKLAGVRTNLGISNNPPVVQPPAPAPQPTPQTQPQNLSSGLGIVGIIKNRNVQIDKAVAGYANGGRPGGGKIKGKGTPTSDSIPAKVKETGEPIKVSNTERILSAAQDAMLEDMARKSGFESLDAMLEAGTGKPVGPTIKGGKKAASGGWNIDNKPDEYAKAMQEQVLGRDANAASPSFSVGAGLAPTIYDNGGLPTTTDRVSGSLPVAKHPVTSPGSSLFDKDPLTAMSSGVAKSMASSDSANAELQNLYPAGTFGNTTPPQPATAKTGATTGSAASVLPQSSYLNEGRGIAAQITKSNTGAVVDNEFTQGGKNYNVNPTSQDGIKRVTAAGTSPLYTNIDPSQGVSGLKNQTIGQPAEQEAQGLARIANANKIRGEMIANRDKDIPAGGYAPSILADRSVEDNAALDAMRRSSMISNLSPSQQAEFNMNLARMAQQERGQNLAADTARYTADAQEKRAAGHDQTLATIEANKLAGNPLEQQAKQLDLKQKGIIAGLFEKANAGDKDALAKYIALTNGGKEPNYSNRYITLPNRKTYNDMGQVTGEEPGGVFDAQTGQPVNFGKQPAASAPPGYKLVGTSGGRPVYEDAKGNRFVDGGK